MNFLNMFSISKEQLPEATQAEKRGDGRIYWKREDSTCGSAGEPIWIPKSMQKTFFEV